MKTAYFIFGITLLFALSCSEDDKCVDPYPAWLGQRSILRIEGIDLHKWLENKINTSSRDRLVTGTKISTSTHWNFTFQNDGYWYSGLSTSGTVGLAGHLDLTITFDGTYTVTEDRYKMKLNNIESNNDFADISPVTDFLKSQLSGTWEYKGLCGKYIADSRDLSRFGKFTVRWF